MYKINDEVILSFHVRNQLLYFVYIVELHAAL